MAEHLIEKYKKDTYGSLRKFAAFGLLEDSAVSVLDQGCRWLNLLPGERLASQADRSKPEHFYFVVEGQLGISRSMPTRDTNNVSLKIVGGVSQNPHAFLTMFVADDCFSDAYLRVQSSDQGLDCIAITETVLVAVAHTQFAAFLQRYPEWAKAIKERNAIIRDRQRDTESPDKAAVQNFFLRNNYSFAKTLKVIDLNSCIGCDGCERACAERHGVARLLRKGPVLGVLSFPISCRTCEDHRCLPACGFDALTMAPQGELKVNKDKCVGCRACYEACPNGVITMLETPYTLKDFPNPMPNTDLEGRTNVPGLYLVGEASGAALIKVAINGGVKAIEAIAGEMQPAQEKNCVLDVIIVGAGPGGLGAALTAKEKGFDFKVFDKGHYATTIQTYPRHKVVMAEPTHIPLFGNLWLKNTTKEELIEKWGEVIKSTGLQINSNEAVNKVNKAEDGIFDVETSKGKYRARRVVLSTGNRGAPRTLGVKGEAEPRVLYALTNPDDFKGKHVLVVGGGDSAVEAARSLADAGAASSAISYRQDKFGRIKARNAELTQQYEKEGKIRVILNSSVSSLDNGKVILKVKDGDNITLENDTIFALLGAEPPTKFFKEAGVEILEPGSEGMAKLAASRGTRFYSSKCDHCDGHSDQACIQACPTGAIFELEPAALFKRVDPQKNVEEFNPKPFIDGLDDPKGRSWLKRFAPWIALSAGLITVLIGLECFLRNIMPHASAEAYVMRALGKTGSPSFTSGQGLGYYLGIAGTLLMVVTALYPLHSRFGYAKKLARTKFWLAAHIWAGLLGPAFVTYHTVLKVDRWPSVAFWAMWMVIFSGAIGRSAYTALRKNLGLMELEGEMLSSDRQRVLEQAEATRGKTAIMKLDELFAKPLERTWLFGLAAPLIWLAHELTVPARYAWLRWVALRNVLDPALKKNALTLFMEQARNRRRKMLVAGGEKTARVWRTLHISATTLMFAVALVHIVVALLFRAEGGVR